MRLELMYAGATNRCVNQLHQYRQNITGIVGIEPTPTVLETVVLPLNYIPITKWKGVDSNHRTRRSGFTVRRV